MRNEFDDYTTKIEDGNSIKLTMRSTSAMIHLEGSGDIVFETGVDGETYTVVEHKVVFDNGVAIAPIKCHVGDFVKITCGSLTKVLLNTCFKGY